MGRRVSAWLAWSLVALAVALLLGGVSLSHAARSTAPELPLGSQSDPIGALITLATVLTFSIAGAVVMSRHPRNTIGWLFSSTGLVVGPSSLARGG